MVEKFLNRVIKFQVFYHFAILKRLEISQNFVNLRKIVVLKTKMFPFTILSSHNSKKGMPRCLENLSLLMTQPQAAGKNLFFCLCAKIKNCAKITKNSSFPPIFAHKMDFLRKLKQFLGEN